MHSTIVESWHFKNDPDNTRSPGFTGAFLCRCGENMKADPALGAEYAATFLFWFFALQIVWVAALLLAGDRT